MLVVSQLCRLVIVGPFKEILPFLRAPYVENRRAEKADGPFRLSLATSARQAERVERKLGRMASIMQFWQTLNHIPLHFVQSGPEC